MPSLLATSSGDETIFAVGGLLGLMALAWTLSGALRRLDVVGAAVLGGVIAGVLLGPTLLGRVAPSVHERAFVGGVEERQAVFILERELDAWETALRAAAPAAPDPIADIGHADERATRRHDIAEATVRMERAVNEHRRPLRSAAVLLGVLTVVASCWTCRPRPRSTSAVDGGGWAIGSFGAAVAGAGGIGVAMLIGESPLGAASLSCAAALAVGPWWLSWRDLRIARNAEPNGPETIVGAARVAAILCALLLALAALALPEPSIAALVAAGLIGGGAALAIVSDGSSSARHARAASMARLAAALSAVAIPAIAALVTVRLEILLDARLWPLLLIPLLTGDGRWLGGMVGALLLGGRGPGPASRLLLVLGAAGPTQLAIAAIGLWTELLSRPLALGLVAGALLVELTGPLRRRAERTICAAESGELDDSA